MRPVLVLLVTLACVPAPLRAGPAPQPAARPVPRTHAHNDYLHEHPLLDALHHGFVGVEADVFLVGNELRVAHDKVKDWTTVPTLESAYLKPLAALVKQRNGRVYEGNDTRLLLLIDLKTEAESTYRRLHEVLACFQSAQPGLFTKYSKSPAGDWTVTRGAVDVVISGNRPREFMAAQPQRYAACDGRLADVGPDQRPDESPEFLPLISDNWKTLFKDQPPWDGTGEVPPAVRQRIVKLAADVHAEGKQLRLWNLPKDAPAVWSVVYDAGVDLINTDDLPGLAAYIRSRTSSTGVPPVSDPSGTTDSAAGSRK